MRKRQLTAMCVTIVSMLAVLGAPAAAAPGGDAAVSVGGAYSRYRHHGCDTELPGQETPGGSALGVVTASVGFSSGLGTPDAHVEEDMPFGSVLYVGHGSICSELQNDLGGSCTRGTGTGGIGRLPAYYGSPMPGWLPPQQDPVDAGYFDLRNVNVVWEAFTGFVWTGDLVRVRPGKPDRYGTFQLSGTMVPLVWSGSCDGNWTGNYAPGIFSWQYNS